ncbi:hypothetical protein RJ640_001825 [Escallonia rubra]|uniref:Pentatricopeptide repeat-containing protein n=1 Tax=Escallonia rubra TaxID=112253 RepID=A0AA88QUK2_9ASTE|nr:hypothetical protein RJ640_001825 [Escallonia rubra]
MSTMLSCLVDYKRIGVILDMNAMMVNGLRQEWFPYLNLYNFVIVGLFKKDEVEMGLEFHWAIKRGFVPDIVVCNKILRRAKIGIGIDLYDLMIARGIDPDLVIYSILVDSLSNTRKLKEGHCLILVSLDRGIKLDVVILSSILDASIRGGDFLEGIDVYKRMLKRRLEQLEYGIKLYTQMSKLDVLPDRGFAPDAVTYCTLIDGFCEKRNLTAGLSIFKLMLKNGVYPDIAVYNALISMFFKEGRVKNAFELFRQVSEVGPRPDTVT